MRPIRLLAAGIVLLVLAALLAPLAAQQQTCIDQLHWNWKRPTSQTFANNFAFYRAQLYRGSTLLWEYPAADTTLSVPCPSVAAGDSAVMSLKAYWLSKSTYRATIIDTLTVVVKAPTPNAPPTSAFTLSCNGLTCTFADASSDADGTVTSHAWDFGDGARSTVANPSHTYAAAGSYTVRLDIADDRGATAATSRVVSPSIPPPPPPPPPPADTTPTGAYQPVISDAWKYPDKAALKAAGGFWWYRPEDVWQDVELVPDATFGQVVRITMRGDTATGWAPKYDRNLPAPIDKAWFRFTVKFSPGWTSAGPLPAGYDNSWKMAFLTYEGFGSRMQIAFANTGSYNLTFNPQRTTDGQFVRTTETMLPGSGANFGVVTTEWSDAQWYEYVMYYQKIANDHVQARWWRRRLTVNGVKNPGPWTFIGNDHKNPNIGGVPVAMPRIRAITLGANRNKNAAQTMYVYWGPWEVVDGSRYANPFGMPNL